MLTPEIARAFIACLDEGRYYDAHEVLEALWYPRRFEKDPEVLLLKGMINASVSFELHRRGREDRAKGPWKSYEKYRIHLDAAVLQTPLYGELDARIRACAARKGIALEYG